MILHQLVTREVNLLPVFVAIVFGLIGMISVVIYIIVWILRSRRKKKNSQKRD